jgi:hypothetical protein
MDVPKQGGWNIPGTDRHDWGARYGRAFAMASVEALRRVWLALAE